MTTRPTYRDLPDGCAWDVLDAELGSLERLTAARVVDAARLVRRGVRFSLDLPLDVPAPPFFGREAMRHEIFELFDHVLDDRRDNFFPQASTQWDGFGHFGHSTRGFFGSRTADQVRGDRGVLAWTEQGIVGRGVLLDVARRVPIPADGPFVVTPELLDETAADQGVEVRDGDVCCIRVGWLSRYRTLDPAGRQRVSDASRSFVDVRSPGLGPGPAIAEWLWDHGVAAVAVDNPGVEPFPVTAALPPGGGIDDTVHTRGSWPCSGSHPASSSTSTRSPRTAPGTATTSSASRAHPRGSKAGSGRRRTRWPSADPRAQRARHSGCSRWVLANRCADTV